MWHIKLFNLARKPNLEKQVYFEMNFLRVYTDNPIKSYNATCFIPEHLLLVGPHIVAHQSKVFPQLGGTAQGPTKYG